MAEGSVVVCPSCGLRMKVLAGGEGKVVKCPKCSTAFRPAVQSPAAEPATSVTLPAEPRPASASPNSDPHLNRTFGGYRLLKRIGRGGMGAVYEAVDAATRRRAAVKIVSDEINSNPNGRRRLLREAQAAAAVNHPNVVGVYAAGEVEGVAYIVMPLVRGETASQRLARSGPMPASEATRIVRLAALGLSAAHAAGLIHRDVKPANILLDDNGDVKLADLGCAKIPNEEQTRLTMTGQIIGTPEFMSPEQWEGAAVDARTDVYALGVTYYFLLTGRAPFQEEGILAMARRHISDPPPDPRLHRADIPAECVRVIDKALAKEPSARFKTAFDMATELNRFEATLRRREEVGKSAESQSSGETMMLDEAAVADLLAEPSSDEISAISTDLYEGLGRSPEEARAAAVEPVRRPNDSSKMYVGPVPAKIDEPRKVEFKFRYEDPAAAKAGLDFLRSDLRQMAKKVIAPALYKGKKVGLLTMVISMSPADAVGVLKMLLYGGGQFVSVEAGDPPSTEFLRRQAMNLAAKRV